MSNFFNRFLFCSGVIFLLFNSNLFAQVNNTRVFVAVNGSNSNTGSEFSPVLSINRAVEIAKSGDTIILKPGIYRDSIRIGINKRPLTIASEFILNNDTSVISKTVIDGSGFAVLPLIIDSSSLTSGNQFAGNKFQMNGITVRNWKGQILENARDIEILNMSFLNVMGGSIKSVQLPVQSENCFLFSSVKKSEFRNSLFENCGELRGGTVINFGILELNDSTSVSHNKFVNNYVWAGVITVNATEPSSKVEINGNFFTGNKGQSFDLFSSCWLINLVSGLNVSILNNIFSKNVGTVRFQNFNSGSKVYFGYNTLVDNRATADWPLTIVHSNNLRWYYIYNSVFQDSNGRRQIGTTGSLISKPGPVLKIFNSIFGPSATSFETNSPQSFDTLLIQDSRVDDIGFVNAAANNFALSDTSVGLSYGTLHPFLVHPEFDYLGRPRSMPYASRPDIGAIESNISGFEPILKFIESGDKRVQITWNQQMTFKKYRYQIFRSDKPIIDTTRTGWLAEVDQPLNNTFTDSINILNNIRYYYRVQAIDSSGAKSGLSNELSVKANIPPQRVTGLSILAGPSIALKWRKLSLPNGISYTVYRGKVPNSDSAAIISYLQNDTSFVDREIFTGRTYYYWVKAVDSSGSASEFSQALSASVTSSWFVDVNGNDNNNGSFGSPLKTISRAILYARNKDSLLVRDGTYAEDLDLGGKSLIIKSVNGAKNTIITGSDTVSVSRNFIRVNSVQSRNDDDNMHFIGFTFKPTVKRHIQIDKSRSVFKNSIFTGFQEVFKTLFSTQFENSIFTDNFYVFGPASNNFVVDNLIDTTLYGYGPSFVNCVFNRNFNFVNRNTMGFPYLYGSSWSTLFMNCIMVSNGPYATIPTNWAENPTSTYFDRLTYVNTIIDTGVITRPIFLNEGVDYRLNNFSVGIGKGILQYTHFGKLYTAPQTDFDGNPRPSSLGSLPDIGAHENVNASALPEIKLIQRSEDTVYVNWEFAYRSSVQAVLIYRDSTSTLDTAKAIKKFRVYSNQNPQFIDTLTSNGGAKVFYTIRLLLTDGTITPLSITKEANGLLKQKSFLPPMVNAKYAWGDIDADGDLDLAVMGETPGVFFQIYKNNSGNFSEILNRSSSPQLFKGNLKFADIDNDKDIDLIVTGQKTLAINNLGTFLFRNNGKGDFQVQEMLDIVPTRQTDMSFADHDNDGDLDLALCGIDVNGISRILVYNNNGTGGFTEEKKLFNSFQYSPSIVSTNVKWGDYDNDGDQDLLFVGSQGLFSTGVLINTLFTGNQANAFLGSNVRLYEALRPINPSIDVADMNNDGWSDLVVSGNFINNLFPNQVRGNASIIAFGNAGGFDFFSAYKLDNVQGEIKAADLDNDGDVDVIVAGKDDQLVPKTAFYFNDGTGRQFETRNFQVVPNLDLASFSIADYDNDKDVDLVISGQKSTAQGGQVISEIFSFEPDIRKNLPQKPSKPTIQSFGDGRLIVSLESANPNQSLAKSQNYLLHIGRIGQSGARLKSSTVVEANNNGGILLNPEASLIYGNKYFTQLDPGNYYFVSQVVDNNKLSSLPSDTLFFTLVYPWKLLNQGGIVNSVLSGNVNQVAKWGDIDRDNDYDFIFGGTIYESDKKTYNASTYTYSNQFAGENTFNLLNSLIKPYVKWHDINQDGISDLIFSATEPIPLNGGVSPSFQLNIYKNDTSLTSRGRGTLTRLSLDKEDSIYLGNSRFKISDLDNDGKPDILFAGIDRVKQSKVHIFTTAPLPTDTITEPGFKLNRLKTNLDSILLANKSFDLIFDFGDVDGDSDNDFVTFYKNELGDFIASTYLNDGINPSTGKLSFRRSTSYSFEPLNNASIDLLDFDKDGDLDLLTTGRSFTSGQQFNIYESKNGGFVKIANSIPAFEFAKFNFGDINNDGYTDLIYSGNREGSGLISKIGIYNPQTKLFQEQALFLFGEEFTDLNIEFGDYDADNDLDLLVNGQLKGTTSTVIFRIYKNVQNESALTVSSTGVAVNASGNAMLSNENSSSVINLNSLDNPITNVTLQETFIENAPPSTPANLSSRLVSRNGSIAKISFSWDAALDDNTPSEGLTYELRVGRKSGIADEVISLSLPNGYRMVAEDGNTGRKRIWDIDLKPGTYFWSVQAVDASYAGSSFAQEQSFSIDPNGQICNTNAPLLTISGSASFCEGDSVILNADRKSEIQWFKNDKLITGAADSLLKVFETGTYTAKYGSASCSSVLSSPVQINVKPRPAAGSLTASASAVCEGTKVILTASSDSVYQWFRNDTLLNTISVKSIETTIPALYSVNSKVNGCVSLKSSAVSFKVNPFPKAIISKNSDIACEGSFVTLNAFSENGYAFQWQKNGVSIVGATGSTFNASETGRYSVTVSLNGCVSTSASDSISIILKPAKPSIVKEGVELVSSSGIGNQWYADGNAISGANQQRYKPTSNGNHAVAVTVNGCQSSLSESYYFLVTALSDLPTGQYIKIYPNPVTFSGKVTIEKKLDLPNELVTVFVLDQTGKVLDQKKVVSDKYELQLPFVPGSYIILIKKGNLNIMTYKIFR